MTNRPLRAMLAVLCLFAAFAATPRAYADGALYFPSTGHHLTDDQGFLTYWREHNSEALLGFPISEAFAADSGIVQYFQRGRLEQFVDTDGAAQVRTGAIGADYAVALWRQFPAAPPRKASRTTQVFEATGHTLRDPFLSFWKANGGENFFGAPISEPLWELTTNGRRQVQYFERARLERNSMITSNADAIVVSDLGSDVAALLNIDTARRDNIGYESYGPAAPLAPDIGPLHPTAVPVPTAAPAPPAPKPVAPAAQPQAQPSPSHSGGAVSSRGKLIVVNLSDQWMYAYQDGEQVFSAPVSTGRDGMNTPTGTYAIYSKLKSQTMDGVTDGKYWVVPNVPNVMYINGGVALHGTYWHNKFGTGARLSHGCINLPLKSAAWLYDWAPMGTTVKVTY